MQNVPPVRLSVIKHHTVSMLCEFANTQQWFGHIRKLPLELDLLPVRIEPLNCLLSLVLQHRSVCCCIRRSRFLANLFGNFREPVLGQYRFTRAGIRCTCQFHESSGSIILPCLLGHAVHEIDIHTSILRDTVQRHRFDHLFMLSDRIYQCSISIVGLDVRDIYAPESDVSYRLGRPCLDVRASLDLVVDVLVPSEPHALLSVMMIMNIPVTTSG